MKKYNVVNYVRWKNDVVESIRSIPLELREQAENNIFTNLNREQTITMFLPLVENISRKFSTTQQASGVMTIMDLIQEGSSGLTKAVDRLDLNLLKESPDQEKTIKSFLSKRIRGQIRRAIDINRGDPQNGWDTDQFHNDPKEIALIMRHILLNGGMKNGGFNFDAKLRRQSIDAEDLFIAHIGGIDNLARGLINGVKLIEEKVLNDFLKKRYQDWSNEEGQMILSGELSLEQLSNLAQDPEPKSGKQEFLENYINRIIG